MLTLTCPRCYADLSLPPRRLVLRVDPGPGTAGEVLFTCLSCHATVTLVLDRDGVAAALAAGVTHLTMSDELAAGG